MKNLLLVVVFTFVCFLSLFSQSKNPVRFSPKWGDDILVINNDITGKFHGVQTQNGNIYLAVIDEITIPGTAFRIMYSTNNGVTFSDIANTSVGGTYTNVKMLRRPDDSIFCFYQKDNKIYCWNFFGNTTDEVPIDFVNSFDAEVSSTGSFFIFADSSNNYIYRFASTDGGRTWPQKFVLDQNAASPKICKSATGDTLIVNYYYDLQPTKENSAIAGAMYNQNEQGLLNYLFNMNVVPYGAFRTEFKSAKINDKIWTLYTEWNGSNIDILGMISTNGGITYVGPVPVANNQDIQEYWFDLTANKNSLNFELIFYSDSLQSGPSNNQSDKLIYSLSPFFINQFSIAFQISSHQPYWSPKEYSPKIVLLPYNTNNDDLAAFWMGLDGDVGKLYMNSVHNITGVNEYNPELPKTYSLLQNYPNPFNPSTKITYEIPLNPLTAKPGSTTLQNRESGAGGFVSFKIYDILGKEIETLVNEPQAPGKYSVEWNGSKYPSGIYFFKLTAGKYQKIIKGMLLK